MTTEQFVIERAQRSHALCRLAMSAVSGAGKTAGALYLARGMVEYMQESGAVQGLIEGKIGVIDTERKSAQLYAHIVPFDAITLLPPYTPERYIGAMRALERAGCKVIIIDQISHAWAGSGGMLERVDLLQRAAKNQFDAWREASPEQNEFVENLLGSSAHLICTMRAKTVYTLEEYTKPSGGKGTRPKKIGMAPVQRAGIEYEFTTMLDIDLDTHHFSVSKDRTNIFEGQSSKLSPEWGKKLMHWLLEGEEGDRLQAENPTELQLAEAAAGQEKRNMLRCKNMPDLEAAFAKAWKRLQEFKGRIGAEDLGRFAQGVHDAKERVKTTLGSLKEGARPTQPVIDADCALALEGYAGGWKEELLTRYEIPRLSLLPAAKLQDACHWVHDQQIDEGGRLINLPAALARAGCTLRTVGLIAGQQTAGAKKGAFDDMKDDIPF